MNPLQYTETLARMRRKAFVEFLINTVDIDTYNLICHVLNTEQTTSRKEFFTALKAKIKE